MNKKYWILLTLLTTMFSALATAQTEQPILPGSSSELDKAIQRADLIVVGKLVSLGITVPDSPGQANYDSAQVAVTKVLKGSSGDTLTVSISVHFSKGKIEEIAPQEGKEYLFFIHTDQAKRLVVLKILPADASNVNAVTTTVSK